MHFFAVSVWVFSPFLLKLYKIIAVEGVTNLLEGYGNDNHANAHGA